MPDCLSDQVYLLVFLKNAAYTTRDMHGVWREASL